MTTLRAGLHPPRRQTSATELERLRAYLDGQSRVHLAAWASHDHLTPDGVDQDDHLLLGISDADWNGDNASALEIGIGSEVPYLEAWMDLFAMSDATTVRNFAEVLWERHDVPAEDLDVLDFRITWEPLHVSPRVAEVLPDLLRDVPGVRRIEGCRERLWKNGRVVQVRSTVFVDFDERRPYDFQQINSALLDAGVTMANSSMSAGTPGDERVRTAVLYAR